MANILETVVFADGETANTQQATGTQTAAKSRSFPLSDMKRARGWRREAIILLMKSPA